MKVNTRRRVWRGITTTTASLLAFTVAGTTVVNSFRTDIDKFLGTTSTMMVTEDVSEEDYRYKSDYGSTTELVQSIAELGERMSEEGTVLLKNNGALPLSQEELQKVSLLGFTSYYPLQGGDRGSSLTENEGTDADTVDMVQAFTEKGFVINPTLQSMYESMKEEFKSDPIVRGNGTTTYYYHLTAPTVTGTFRSIEPTQDRLNEVEAGWKESMNDYNTILVTIGRSSSEGGNYLPGEEGVNPDQDLNQTDPLGLSDDERATLEAAIEVKKATGGKVIVLLNNSCTMEIQELVDNDDVDAILEISLPGGYGFYGVADVLSGDANPSGHLADTYAVKNANSPAAQNYGIYNWTNADANYWFESEMVEAENIYTGYKYYETRYADTVLEQGNASSATGSSTDGSWAYETEVTYPFGYGLSYTTFEQKLEDVEVDLEARTVTAEVTVTNTGDTAGKDAVQFYVSVPYTDYDREHQVEKSAVQLLDYEKTKELKPGESQTITITADAQDMASWDSSCDNEAGTSGNYILDAGDYYFTVGDDVHAALNNVLAAQGNSVDDGMTSEGDSKNVKVWSLDEFDKTSFAYSVTGVAVENQLEDMDLNYYMPDTVTYLSRNDWSGTWPKTYKDLTATDEMLIPLRNDIYEITDNGDPESITFGADNGLSLVDVIGLDIEDEKWSDLMDQITLEECMIRTAFGGTSVKTIASITSPEAVQNDGPNGFNSYPLGQYANTDTNSADPYAVDPEDKNLSYTAGVMGCGTLVGQTFNKELASEYGAMMGNYSIWANQPILWGAGTNLHRCPYNARNHEYYSEDPVLTAYQAANYIQGGEPYGVILAAKHFAFNDTEINREGLSCFMNEQKARENELRGTQACVEDAHMKGVMTAFNRVGVTQSNAHTGLMMNILHKEWGFVGLMSEDFIVDAGLASLKEMVQNGVSMTVHTGDDDLAAVAETWDYWTLDNVSRDENLVQSLKTTMMWQNYALANSNAMDGLNKTAEFTTVKTWYDNALTAAQIIFAVLTIAAVLMYAREWKKGKGEKE